MPIDARIPLQGNQPEPLINMFAKMQSMRGAQQENQLRQAQMGEYERKLQDQNALRSTLAGFTPDMTPEAQVSALQRGGHLPEARMLAESFAKTAADRRAEEKSGLEAEHKRLEIRGQVYGSVAANPTLETAKDALDYLVGNKLVDPANADQVWQKIQANPTPDNIRGLAQQFQTMSVNAKDQLARHFAEQDYGGGKRIVSIPQYGPGPATVVPGSEITKTVSPDAAATRADRAPTVTTIRDPNDPNRNLQIDARTYKGGTVGEAGVLGESSKPTETAKLDARELAKREAAYPQATTSVKSVEGNTDALITKLNTLRDHPGLSGMTGLIAGRTWNLTGPAREAQALYKQIMATGQFGVLQSLRESSKTGGALGNVSDTEGKALRDSFGALDQTQDTPSFQKGIDAAITDLERTKRVVREGYDATYEYKSGGSGRAAPADSKPRAMSGEDKQALDWANANPNDKRAAAIKQRLGM